MVQLLLNAGADKAQGWMEPQGRAVGRELPPALLRKDLTERQTEYLGRFVVAWPEDGA